MKLPRFLRWSAYRLRTKGLFVVAMPVLPLVVFWLIPAVALIRHTPPTNTNARNLMVQSGLDRVFNALLDADAGARDHLLTDDLSALERTRAAFTRLPATMAQLDNSVIDTKLRDQLAFLNWLINDEHAIVSRLTLEAAPPQFARLNERQLLNRSASNLGRVRELVEDMERRQAALATTQEEINATDERVLFWMLLAGSVICVGGGVIAALVLAGGISRRVGMLSKNADRLARGEAIRPLPGGDDEIATLDGRFRDAARLLREREKELRESGQLLDSFFNLSHDLFCIVGFDGQFRRLNPAWATTLDFTTTELMAAPFLDLVHPDDRSAADAAFAGLIEGREFTDLEARYRCRDGNYRWLRWNARPRVEEGLVYASARDVTDKVRLDAALESRTAELEAANHELEAFSYSVSHDLRAPLRAIDGFSQTIEEDQVERLDDNGRDALRRVRGAARRMGQLIDGLLNLSRLTQIGITREPLDLGAAAASIVADLTRRAPTRRVDVRIEPNLMIDADPQLVHIALENLLDNAWKYTGKTARARIDIGSTANGTARVFHVRDNGAGFDMAYSSKLFGAFQRLHSDRDFEGTGIGLATVHRIVKRHGGKIWADSELNAGATFYFTLEPEVRDHA